MAWTKPINGLLSLSLAAALWPALAAAQSSQEPLWRAQNPDEQLVVPGYAGGLSPFPQTAPAAELIPPPELAPPSPEAQQAMAAAGILTEIRQLLTEASAFEADFGLLNVRAITIGPAGARALVGTRWVKPEDTIFVPQKQNARASQLLQQLQTIDPNLAEAVASEVNAQILAQGPQALRVQQIGRGQIEVVSPDGQRRTLPFTKAPW